MTEFKKGMKVKRTKGDHRNMCVGDIDTIVDVRKSILDSGFYNIDLKKFGFGHSSENFKIIAPIVLNENSTELEKWFYLLED